MLRNLIALSILLVSLSACRDDFSLEAPAEDIPVIYAYLDAQAADNFLRVERVFVDAGGDANNVARNVDSLYYDPEAATVTVSTGNSTVELERVNGDDFGLEREEGVFAETPNVLYRLSSSDLNLQEGNRVTVNVTTDKGTVAEASTLLLPEIEVRNPSLEQGINPAVYEAQTTFRWNVGGEEARVFDVRLYYNIRELPEGSTEFNEVRLEQVIASNLIRTDLESNVITVQVGNESIWQFIADRLDPNAPVQRIFDNFDLVIVGVGEEVADLIDLSNANSGITSSQAPPLYTNVEGGLGVVTSRSIVVREGIPLNSQSRPELRDGQYTGNLNFQ